MITGRQNQEGISTDGNGNPVQPTTSLTSAQQALVRPEWVAYRGYGSGVVGYDKYGRVELRGFTGNVYVSRLALVMKLGPYASVLKSTESMSLDDLIALVDVKTTGYAGKLTIGSQMLTQIIGGINAGSIWNTEVMRFVIAYSDPTSVYYRGDTANPADPNYTPGDKLNDVAYQNDFLAETIAAKDANGNIATGTGPGWYWLAGGLILFLLYKRKA